MPEDYYDDGPSEGAGRSPVSAPGRPDPEENDSDSDETAVLPKSILMGKKFEPGDELVLRVVRIHDDEIEVAYASDEGEGEGGGGRGPGGPPPDDSGDMDQMMG